MPISIAHTGRVSGGRTTAEAERDDLRELLAAVGDALDLPAGPQRPALLGDRALLVLGTIRDVLDGRVRAPFIPFETEQLRLKLSETHQAGDGHG